MVFVLFSLTVVQFVICVLFPKQDCNPTFTVWYHPSHTKYLNKYVQIGTITFSLIPVLTRGKEKRKERKGKERHLLKDFEILMLGSPLN